VARRRSSNARACTIWQVTVDADTLARAQRGDAEARRAIVAAHAGDVLAIVGDPEAAERVLAAVLADLPKYRLGAGRLSTWVRTRAENEKARQPEQASLHVDAPDLDALIARVLITPAPAEAPRPRARLGLTAAIVAGAAAIAIVIAIARAPSRPVPRTGAIAATGERRQVLIPSGVAVLEPGAALAWTDARVDHQAGTIYYRIERAITIATPHGAIRTGHASLRVAVAATTVVTIDEGDAIAGATPVSAGGRAELP
jgi:hypothetical protein